MQVTEPRPPRPATREEVADPMERLERRLDRIERMLEPVAEATAQLPGLTAFAGDVFDEWATQNGSADARLRELGRLLDRLSQPEMLRTLHTLVDQVEAMPGLVATVMDTADEAMAEAAAHGVDVGGLVETLQRIAVGVVRTAPQIEALFASGMMDERTLATLGRAADHIADASKEPAPQVGMLGTLRALRDPDVQRALGFALRVAKGFGRAMESDVTPAKQLPPG